MEKKKLKDGQREEEEKTVVRISRVLNTNAVVTKNEKGKEVIITGSGIGFKKKKGEQLDETLIDRIYYLQEDTSKKLQRVVEEISEEYLAIVGRVLDKAKEENLKVRDSLYVTLTDHIHSAVERYRNGMALKNMMKLEIRKFYPKEYGIGQKAIVWIEEQSGVNLGEDEVAFIAMHIIAAEFGTDKVTNVKKITDLVTTVLKIVRMHFKIDFDEESISYERFLIHLKFFAGRVLDQHSYQDSMEEVYEVLVRQNEYAYSGVKKIDRYIEKQYGNKLSIDEQLYLLIHIKRILDEQGQRG